ncbi:hypothetical protein ACFOQM_04080 [Paenibacillus sp. GCM10012307]|uniref:Uncharacterized protein n=1 Tax=Paenibacillus roseus TaxID=2798579 RepID=A0A934MN07_9BACL|nr:hypothetical protein [Paenibacillus roseus]MBJ6360491.1 hypothetical protein [Paenibacillus roseus]
MAVTVKRVLVQGEATFTISCNELMALVTPEQAADEVYMAEWLREQSYKIVAAGHSSHSECEYSNDLAVEISQETADKFTGKIISKEAWEAVKGESESNAAGTP